MRLEQSLATAAHVLQTREPRIPTPPSFGDALHRVSILMSAALSQDGVRFDVRLSIGPGAGDASATIESTGAGIVIHSVPESFVGFDEINRAAGVLMVASIAYVEAWRATETGKVADLDDPATLLARAAVSAPVEAVRSAARRLCH